jgi:hypothetical protein
MGHKTKKMNKEEAIKKVDECISSIFSKEDVKKLINEITLGVWLSDERVVEHTINFINENDHLIEVEFENAEFSYNVSGDQHGIKIEDFNVESHDVNLDKMTTEMDVSLLSYLEDKMNVEGEVIHDDNL